MALAMNVLLLGATGKVGRPILDELVRRDHTVTAVARDVSGVPAGVLTAPGDVFDEDFLSRAAAGMDAVVCSVALRDPLQAERTPTELLRRVGAAAATAGARLLTLGGAGSLRTAAGCDLVDAPEFPEVARKESAGFRDALRDLRVSAPDELRWTMLSPPAEIDVAGVRTGRYRTGTDDLLVDAHGRSRISAADLAVALVDELEQLAHERSRFTAAY
jgi:putative NADH-flavin reductase